MDQFTNLGFFQGKKDNNTKGLKSLLSVLEKEKESNVINKIYEIIDYLSEMNFMQKCDINYQKFFPILFNKLKLNSEKEENTFLIIKVYLLLSSIFPDIKDNLIQFLPKEKNYQYKEINNDNQNKIIQSNDIENEKDKEEPMNVLNAIHNISDSNKRLYCYLLYTNFFNQINNIECNDLIKIYHCLFCYYFLTEDEVNCALIEKLSLLLVKICEYYLLIMGNKYKVNRECNSPYILLQIESFIDFIIFSIMLLSSNENAKDQIEKLIDILNTIIDIYFDINSMNDIMIYKIVYFLSFLYSYISHIHPENQENILNNFIALFQKKFNSLFNVFFDIVYTMNIGIINKKVIYNFIESYFDILIDNNTEMRHYLLENSMLNKYNECMQQIGQWKKEYNVFKGSFKIIRVLMTENFDEIIHMKHLFTLIEIISNSLSNNQDIYNCDFEILQLIDNIVNNSLLLWASDEWKFFIKICMRACKRIPNKNSETTIISYFKFIIPIIKLTETRSDCDKDICDILLIFSLLITSPNQEFMLLLHHYCFSTSYQNCNDLFQYSLIFSVKNIKIAPIFQLDFLQNLIFVLQSEDEKKKDIVSQNIILFFDDIRNSIISISQEKYIAALLYFSELIVTIIQSSLTDIKQKVIKLLYTFKIHDKEENQYQIQLRETEIFLGIVEKLIKSFINDRAIISQLLQLSFKKMITEAVDNNTLINSPFCFKLLEYCKLTSEGIIYFITSKGRSHPKDSCVRIDNPSIEKEKRYYYYDVNFIIEKYLKEQITNLESSESGNNYCVIQNVFTEFCFSYSTLSYIIQFFFNNASSIKFLSAFLKPYQQLFITCNYFLNFSSNKYIGFIKEQRNELTIQNEEQKLKDTINDIFLYTFYKNDKKSPKEEDKKSENEDNKEEEKEKDKEKEKLKIFTIADDDLNISNYVLMTFYYNSTLDKSLDDEKVKKETPQSISDILLFITQQYVKAITIMEQRICFSFILTLFTLKDVLKHADTSIILECIYMILTLTRNSSETTSIVAKLSGSNPKFDIEDKRKINFVDFDLHYFFDHLADITLLYYCSYIEDNFDLYNQDRPNKNTLYNYFKKIFETNENRDILTDKMMYFILCSEKQKRSNINEEVINTIKEYTFYTNDNYEILCSKENANSNDYILISPISSYYFNVAFFEQEETVILSAKSKANVISSLISNTNSNEKVKKEKNPIKLSFTRNFVKLDNNRDDYQKITTLLKISTTFNFKVNVFFYSEQYEEIKFENLFEAQDIDDINSLYINFISQLGQIYIDSKGETVLAYKDLFYNIIFEIGERKKTKEEKLNMIKENTISIIWMDNPYIDISNISSLFNEINDKKDHTFIFVFPFTSTHYLIKKYYKRVSRHDNSYVENFFVNNYYINIMAYSSIRYLINNIIQLCEWDNYYNKNENKEVDIQQPRKKERAWNCWFERLEIIKEIIQK